eukprot:GFYU01008916.1.p1 GENE.GFYU01008916.1~~GFYU01008916.1.p1  ORF type:complete len:367 (-),score=164.26 GFYU01008916.1:85-1026(-)
MAATTFKSLLVLVLALALVLCVSHVEAKKKKEKSNVSKCLLCQIMSHNAHEIFTKKAKTASKVGDKDIAAGDTVDEVCGSMRKTYAKYGDHETEAVDKCNEAEDIFEELLEKLTEGMSEPELRASVCKKKKRCKTLWTEEEHPSKKESKAERVLREGKEFLAANKEKEGVTEDDNGVQWKVLEKGKGKVKPIKSDTVKVHYHGTTIDGNTFDSSYDRGTPTEFGVTQVIAGWTHILQKMVRGDIFEVYIPSHLAYGENGSGEKIPGNSVLIFKVELIGVKGKDDEDTDKKKEEAEAKKDDAASGDDDDDKDEL